MRGSNIEEWSHEKDVERALWMATESRGQHPSQWAVIESIAGLTDFAAI
jgi:hypothetical protein